VSIETIGTIIAIIVGLLGILSFGGNLWTKAKREGAAMKEIEQIKKDVSAAHRRIEKLEKDQACSHDDLVELKTDVKHILAAITRLEEKADAK
jgi:hypothetical protein